jgi:TonB family protein
MFENTLLAFRSRAGIKRRLKVLPVALGIHALALGFMVVGQLWAVSEVREPYTVVGLYVPPPLLAPRASDDGRARHKPPTGGVRHHTAVVQPRDVPETPARAAPPETVSNQTLVPAGDGPQDTAGGGGETEFGDCDDCPSEATDHLPIEIHNVGGRVRAPRAVFHPAPAYPELARKLRKQGTVIVEATIDDVGNVVDAKVLRDIGFGCGEAAAQTIRTWRYNPATLEGRPVSVYLTVTVSFELHGVE